MSQLSCSVHSCINNRDNLCTRPSIKVDGVNASRPFETNCDSYQKRQSSFTDSVSYNHPESTTLISCTVDTCSYYAAGRCTAEYVNVVGGRSDTRHETSCATFHDKNK